MSLKASLEILLHLRSLRNIDLFHQGIYTLKTSIYQETNNVHINLIIFREKKCMHNLII